MPRVIYACDIGSTRGRPPNFAWARVSPEKREEVRGDSRIEELVNHLEADLEGGVSIALGIEAPLFIPIPLKAENLSKGRKKEGRRSFAAPPGLAVTTLALHQLTWILWRLHPTGSVNHDFTTDWHAWPPSGGHPVLLCWEAFVSENAHSDSHVRDAATAAEAFLANENDLKKANAVTADRPLSLAGAAALWSGWSNDLGLLHRPTLVIKPDTPYTGPIGEPRFESDH